jgi:hypothetical protein
MSKRRALPAPPAGEPSLPPDTTLLRHLAACAWNFALIDRHRLTRDWRLFCFRRPPDHRRNLPGWYPANEDYLRRQGQRDHPQLGQPFVEAPQVRWLGHREEPGNAFSCGVQGQPAFLPVTAERFEAGEDDSEPTLRFRAGLVVERLHVRLLNAQLMALFVHCLLRGQASLLPRPRRD